MHITIENAAMAIGEAIAKACKIDTFMRVAIVDSGADLKAFHRMDDASVGSIENDHAVATAGAQALGTWELPAHPWRT